MPGHRPQQLAQLVPAAVTLKVAVAGAVTVAPAGCAVIDGALETAAIVSVAALLVTVPAAALSTTTR